MSYSLYDVNGYVGDLATNKGLDYLHQYFEKKKKKVLLDFLDKGAALITKILLNEVASLKPVTKDLKSLIKNLSELLDKCDTVAIISID